MRIVIKIGTNLLTNEDNNLNEGFIGNIANQVSQLKKAGHEVVLVSSGATTAGRSRISAAKENKNIPFRQALAAVGQGLLTHVYKKAFQPLEITIAQILLTNSDFQNRTKYLNILHTLNLLLRLDVFPILNENDVTSINEFAIGENDMLSARVAAMISADLLIILTTVDGLYTGIPGKDPAATQIPEVPEITAHIKEIAKGPDSKNSRGGMTTKILAAEFATQSGVPIIITHGKNENVLPRIILNHENLGTYFPTSFSKIECRKNWLRQSVIENAALIVDQGAENALINDKKSLLSIGVVGVEGTFKRGDVVHIINQSGKKIGLGQVNYGSASSAKIAGVHSREIHTILPRAYEDELINRNELVLL